MTRVNESCDSVVEIEATNPLRLSFYKNLVKKKEKHTGDSCVILLFWTTCSGLLAPTIATGTLGCCSTHDNDAVAMSKSLASHIFFTFLSACKQEKVFKKKTFF